jgi:glycosyltransferase involved in cell wall biosynthesis
MTSGPIRVLYLNNAPFVGGAQITLRNILRRLDRRRFLPFVALPSDRRAIGDFLADTGAEVVYVPMFPISPISVRSLSGLFRTAHELRRLVRRARIDVIHTNAQRGGMVGLMMRPLSRARFIWTLNDVHLAEHVQLLSLLADVRTSVSEAVRSRLPRASTVRLIYNGVETDEDVLANANTYRREIRERLGIPPDAFVVGNVTRVTWWKGVHIAAAAMAEVMRARKNLWFVQVGEASPGADSGADQYAQSVQAIFNDSTAERARFVGFQRDIHRWYPVFDLMLHTPTINQMGHTEAFGMNVAEAMGYGLPVIASAVGGLGEVVEDGVTGILVPDNRPELIAKALTALVENRAARERMGEAGRRRQQTLFSQQREVDDLQDLYEEIVSCS